MIDCQELIGPSEAQLASRDMAELNLLCAQGLPGAETLNVAQCLETIDRWAEHVESEIQRYWHVYRRDPAEFRSSENFYRVLTMVTVLQQDLGVIYRSDLMDDPLDWRDSRGIFVHGLTPQAIDTWALMETPIAGGEFCAGEIIMEGQVRAYNADEIANTIKNWKPYLEFPDDPRAGGRPVFPWTSGSFPAREGARFPRRSLVEVELSGQTQSRMRLEVEWGCDSTQDVDFQSGTPKHVDASGRWKVDIR